MADSRLPDVRKVGISEAPAEVQALLAQEPIEQSPSAERIRRLKRRFLECWNHPRWSKWRAEMTEDWAFHSGTGQWDEALRSKLEKAGRPALTFNRLRHLIQTVIGYERSARMEPKPVPESIGKTPPDERHHATVSVFARLMKRVANDQETQFTESEGFKDGVVGGLAFYYCGVDYADNLINGRPQLWKIKRGECCYDPAAQRYDLEDAREVHWTKLVPLDTLTALYPDAREAIESALYALPSTTPGVTHELPSRDPYDGYRNVSPDLGLTLWDHESREVRVVESWYQVWRTVHLFVDKRRNVVEEIPEEMAASFRALAQEDPEFLKVVGRQRREWEMSVWLPATEMELDHGQPFDNDREHCPIVQYKPYEEGDEFIGLVRNLKDPQRDHNKRRSALIDNVGKHGSAKWFARRGSLENPDFLEGGVDAGAVGWVKGTMAEKPQEMSPPVIPEWVIYLEQEGKADIPDISGVGLPLQGKAAHGRDSGAKTAQLQAAAQIGLGELFDNYRRTKRLIWKRLGKRIQQTFTEEQVVRLESDATDSEWVTLNERTVDEQGRMTVERDIPALQWDVEIAESAATPTARAAMLGALLEFANQFPDYKDAMADLIVDASDFPGKRELKQRVQLIQQAKGILPMPPGQAPPGAGPGARVAGAPVSAPQGNGRPAIRRPRLLPGQPTNHGILARGLPGAAG